ncbi:MAG: P1 family peptidase [Candidatus Aminicenantes bacterium]
MNKRNQHTKRIEPKAGKFPHGKDNSLTDIKGVRIGHLSIHKDTEEKSGEQVCIRTGLTAVFPYPLEKNIRLFIGSYIFRAKHEITGYEVTEDFCYVNSPIVITNSVNVGRAYNAVLSYGFSLGLDETWPPFVVGLDDSFLNDMSRSFLEEKDILKTFDDASEDRPQEGSVGIGLGLRAFHWKGGIGTSSRTIALGNKQFTCGVLVASNHGNQGVSSEDDPGKADSEKGSLVMVMGVDIPLIPYQIKKIAGSCMAGLNPVHSLKNCSDSIICILFSTANPMKMEERNSLIYDFQVMDDSCLEKVILASSEAIREALINSMVKADPVKGRLGRKVETIPDGELNKLIKRIETDG